eukprot:2323820-Ditylum_brightwellii.AAC.1
MGQSTCMVVFHMGSDLPMNVLGNFIMSQSVLLLQYFWASTNEICHCLIVFETEYTQRKTAHEGAYGAILPDVYC